MSEQPVDPASATVAAPKKKKGWLGRLFGGGKESNEATDVPAETLPGAAAETGGETSDVTGAPAATETDTPSREGEIPLPVSVLADAPEAPVTNDDSKTPAPGEASADTGPSAPGIAAAEAGIAAEVEVAGTTPPAEAEESAGESPAKPAKKGWLQRLKEGLARSSSKLSQGIGDLFTRRKLDDEALEELEELLIQADMGVKTASTLTRALAKTRFGKEVTSTEVRSTLAAEATRLLEPVALPLVLDTSRKPHVILVVGVNGAGKTTTIGKMARQYRDQGLQVSLAAGDTFRAAAVEQLKVWGERSGCPVHARETGADAAGLAYDALKESMARGDDVLMIDTAGRLHNKSALMEELQKIRRVIQKLVPEAPHSTLLVLDATVGQNAHQQVKVFGEMIDVTGLVMTKLDGTAKGGVVVALAQEYRLPVHFVGVGEGVEDLRPFTASDFARGLMGLEAGQE